MAGQFALLGTRLFLLLPCVPLTSLDLYMSDNLRGLQCQGWKYESGHGSNFAQQELLRRSSKWWLDHSHSQLWNATTPRECTGIPGDALGQSEILPNLAQMCDWPSVNHGRWRWRRPSQQYWQYRTSCQAGCQQHPISNSARWHFISTRPMCQMPHSGEVVHNF